MINLNLKNLTQCILKFGKTVTTLGHRIKACIFRKTDTDWKWVLIILILGGILRFPFLEYPTQTIFDEPIYADFSMLITQSTPFFDIHPPLARMIYAEILSHVGFHPFSSQIIVTPESVPYPFLNFPYVPLRTAVAIFGTLLPLLLYGIGRVLRYSPRVSGLIALFVVFDPAFIVYSRAILPDTILLVIEMIAVGTAFLSIRIQHRLIRLLLYFISAIALGLALSLKWVALGVCGVVFLAYLFHRKYKVILATGAIVLLVYLGVFFAFLQYFPSGGPVRIVDNNYNISFVTDLSYPDQPSLSNAPQFLIHLHGIMWRANTDRDVLKKLPVSSSVFSWPTAKVSMLGWWNEDHSKEIRLEGNSLLWNLLFLLFFFEVGWIVLETSRLKKWPIGDTESILLAGYLGNYLPFFVIGRSMFLYHYFTAFLFLLLLVPKVAPRAIACVALLSHDKIFARTLSIVILLLVMMNFLLATPHIYGY